MRVGAVYFVKMIDWIYCKIELAKKLSGAKVTIFQSVYK